MCVSRPSNCTLTTLYCSSVGRRLSNCASELIKSVPIWVLKFALVTITLPHRETLLVTLEVSNWNLQTIGGASSYNPHQISHSCDFDIQLVNELLHFLNLKIRNLRFRICSSTSSTFRKRPAALHQVEKSSHPDSPNVDYKMQRAATKQ